MWTRSDERTCWESRRHAVVLVRPLVRGFALGVAGFVCFAIGWPVMLVGPPLIAIGALGSGLSVWRWERTRVVVTTERLFVVHGTLRRRVAAVHVDAISTIEVEQSLVGRLLGYGTLVAGELEIPFVPQPRRVGTLVARLGA
jgi:Bacterial PH domain